MDEPLEFDSRASALQAQADRHLEAEIFEASVSKHSKLKLAQIAAWSKVPLDVVEEVARSLIADIGRDSEKDEFNDVIRQLQHLESSEKDAGLREWKLQSLARRYKRSPKQLMDAYNKALCQQAPVKLLHVSEFKKTFQKEVEWVIQGWIPKGVTLLVHGDGGAGKTLFLYQVMQSFLEGKAWNGYPVQQLPVVLVQVDEPELITAERIDVRGIPATSPLHILSDWQVEAIANLESAIAQLPPGVLIIDSITAVNRNSVFSENDTEYARPILQIRDLARRYGWTIILIHHSNAEGNARGTRAIHNSVDEVWALSIADGNSGDRLLRVQKTRMGRPPGRYKFSFDDETYSFCYQGQDGDDNDSAATNEEKIRLWLSDDEHRGIPYTSLEVAEFLSITQSVVRRSLSELWAKGLLQRKRTPRESGGFQYAYFYPSIENSSRSPSTPERERAREASDTARDQPIKISRSPSTPHEESDLEARDRLITKKAKNSLLKMEKERSSDRELKKTAQKPLPEGDSARDQQSCKSDRESQQGDRESQKSVTTGTQHELKRGSSVEVYQDKRWVSAIYVKPTDSSYFSCITQRLESAHWVEVRGKRVKIAEPDMRRGE